jgi:hypothetical protein
VPNAVLSLQALGVFFCASNLGRSCLRLSTDAVRTTGSGRSVSLGVLCPTRSYVRVVRCVSSTASQVSQWISTTGRMVALDTHRRRAEPVVLHASHQQRPPVPSGVNSSAFRAISFCSALLSVQCVDIGSSKVVFSVPAIDCSAGNSKYIGWLVIAVLLLIGFVIGLPDPRLFVPQPLASGERQRRGERAGTLVRGLCLFWARLLS